MFGGLLRSCIRDDYEAEDKRLMKESVVMLALGVVASVLTTYVFASLGIFV